MNFLWELDDLDDDPEEERTIEDDPDEEIIRNPRRHFPNPKECCACEGPVAEMSAEELSEIIYAWLVYRHRPFHYRCQTPRRARCA